MDETQHTESESDTTRQAMSILKRAQELEEITPETHALIVTVKEDGTMEFGFKKR